MYRTSIDCTPAGAFSGKMIVSMRMMTPADAIRAVQVTSRFPAVHGAPVHIGIPEAIGIKDLMKPDYGDPPPTPPTENIVKLQAPLCWDVGVAGKGALILNIDSGVDYNHSDLKNQIWQNPGEVPYGNNGIEHSQFCNKTNGRWHPRHGEHQQQHHPRIPRASLMKALVVIQGFRFEAASAQENNDAECSNRHDRVHDGIEHRRRIPLGRSSEKPE